MAPGDRLVCAFVDPQPRGGKFTGWPLHVTIVPWFRVPLSTATIVRTLADLMQGQPPFQVTVDGEAHFGRSGQKLVHLVQLPSPLTAIELRVRTYLHEQGAWAVDETTKARRSFRPHVTSQKDAAAHAGQTFMIRAIYVVEQLGSQKEVAGVVEFAS